MISLRPCKRNQFFDRFRRNARSDQDLDPSVASSHQLTQKFPPFPRRIFLSACQDRFDSEIDRALQRFIRIAAHIKSTMQRHIRIPRFTDQFSHSHAVQSSVRQKDPGDDPVRSQLPVHLHVFFHYFKFILVIAEITESRSEQNPDLQIRIFPDCLKQRFPGTRPSYDQISA